MCPVRRPGREHLVRVRDGAEERLASVRFVPLVSDQYREPKPPLLRASSPRAGSWCGACAEGRTSPSSASRAARVLALPKGHIEPGESGAETAVREVREETGVDGRLVEKLDDIRYWYTRDGARVLKVVSFFLLSYRSGSRARLPARGGRRRGVAAAGRGARRASPTRARVRWRTPPCRSSPTEVGSAPVFVLNFYSPVFVDQLRRHRKTATIRLGDKSSKYKKGNVVMVTVGLPARAAREDLPGGDRRGRGQARQGALPARHRARQPRVPPPSTRPSHFLEQIYGRPVSEDDTVTVVRFSEIKETPTEFSERMRGSAPHQN